MSQAEFDPQAGMVPSGSRVVIVVSQGPSAERPGYAEVPQVVGLAQGAALTKLQDAGLQVRVVNDYAEAFKRGDVMGQLPNAGTSVAAGSEVVLLVSSGGAAHYGSPVVLPDVVGMSETDAVSELQAARLAPQLIREYSPTVPAGIVMSQLPNEAWLAAVPGKKQKWWIWITAGLLALAVGLAAVYFFMPMTVIVPDVVGLTQDDAIKAIEAANFEVGRISQAESDKVKEGEVAAQSPHGAVRVREGSKIDIVVSTGEPLLEVPDVVGMSQDDAITQLRAFGLNTRTTTEATSGVDPSTVLEQSPSAGEKVARGTTVGLVVAEAPSKPTLTKVPDLAGFTREDAETMLTEAGLKAIITENASDKVPEGVVITQLPAADKEVNPGQSVGIIISTGDPTDTTTATVPDLVTQTLANGQAVLTQLGLRAQPIQVEATDKSPTEIIGQAPAPGTAVPANGIVLLLYAR